MLVITSVATSNLARRSAVILQIFDDSDTAITYLPSPSAWQTTRAPVFFNDTLQ